MIGHIDGVMFRCVSAENVNFVCSTLRVFFAPAHACNARAFTRQPQRNCMPDPPPRASYDRRLIFESHQAAMLLAAPELSTHQDRHSRSGSSQINLCRYYLRRIGTVLLLTREALARFSECCRGLDCAFRARYRKRKSDEVLNVSPVLPAKFQGPIAVV